MASIKLHLFKGDNDGTVSCDYRGDKFIGHPEDEHRTIAEREFGPDVSTNEDIEFVLKNGPEINKLLGLMIPKTDFIGNMGLRIGVWDN